VHVDRSLTLTIDFSNLWKHCYRFTHASLHTVYNYTWLIAINSDTVSLHYLQRCLCSSVTCRAPIQWFQINSDCTPKKYSYNKKGSSSAGGQWCLAPPFKICALISCLAPRLLHTSNIVFKKCFPLVVFVPPAAKSRRRVWIKTQKNSVTNKNTWVCLFETIIEYWFN